MSIQHFDQHLAPAVQAELLVKVRIVSFKPEKGKGKHDFTGRCGIQQKQTCESISYGSQCLPGQCCEKDDKNHEYNEDDNNDDDVDVVDEDGDDDDDDDDDDDEKLEQEDHVFEFLQMHIISSQRPLWDVHCYRLQYDEQTQALVQAKTTVSGEVEHKTG
eukprot:757432-Hanusia_phi.AAC.1